MSEEAAFLEALKANPADDTARLVFADWLDEHDQSGKAEYLRMVAAIAQREGCLSTAPESWQLVRKGEELPHEWREQAGSRFALVLDSWTDKIRAIKWICEVTGDGLGEAKAASESLPHALFDSVPFEVARAAYDRGKAVGGLGLRILPGPLDAAPHNARSDLVIRATLFNQRGGRARAQAARAALAEVLASVLGISAEDAAARAELNHDIVVETGLTLQEARNRRAVIQQLFPAYEASRGWYLLLYRRDSASESS